MAALLSTGARSPPIKPSPTWNEISGGDARLAAVDVHELGVLLAQPVLGPHLAAGVSVHFLSLTLSPHQALERQKKELITTEARRRVGPHRVAAAVLKTSGTDATH